jgi:membrane-bound inhibitor of C-type lysozyme
MRRLALLACALLAGCGGGSWNPWAGPREEPVTLPPDTVTFQCEGGKRLMVRMPPGAKSVTVMLPERQYRLDAVSGESGRYSNGRTTLVGNAQEAEVSEDGKVLFTACKPAGR